MDIKRLGVNRFFWFPNTGLGFSFLERLKTFISCFFHPQEWQIGWHLMVVRDKVGLYMVRSYSLSHSFCKVVPCGSLKIRLTLHAQLS